MQKIKNHLCIHCTASIDMIFKTFKLIFHLGTQSLLFPLSRSQLRLWLWLPLSGGTDEAVSAAILARVLEERQEAGP
jgi:hypothetical protein